MIKNIIFDWSGTLMDNTNEFYKVVSYMFAKLGREMISFEQFRREFNIPYMNFYNKYFPSLTIEREKELYNEGCSLRKPTSCFLGVKETLEHLHHKNVKLLILSSDPYSRLISEVKNHGLSNLFIEIVTDIDEKDKGLKKLMIKHNFNPKETVHVGDTSGDVEAGKVNGMKTVAITWGIQTRDKLKEAQPDFLIDDVLELKSLLTTN